MTAGDAGWRARLRPWVPGWLRRAKRVAFGWRWYRGRYRTWEEARAQAGGYDAPAILAKVLAATHAVKAGRAAYERDGVTFAGIETERELVEAFREVAAGAGGRLRLIDFGGSLGTHYWQYRHELAGLREVRWDVVEQPHYVRAGREQLEDDTLRFHSSIDAAEAGSPHELLLASGVVQYLPDPHGFLDDLAARGFPWLVFHNVLLHEDEPDYLMVQHVPPEIYPASYPVWFFRRSSFLGHFARGYELVRSYPSREVAARGWRDYPTTGLVFRRR